MSKEKKQLCGECIFCHDFIPPGAEGPDPNIGMCKRFPPQVVIATFKTNVVPPGRKKAPTMQMQQSAYPVVKFVDLGCGELRDKQ